MRILGAPGQRQLGQCAAQIFGNGIKLLDLVNFVLVRRGVGKPLIAL